MQKQLLLVDDDITMIKLFSLLADKNGWIYDTALNLKELQEKLAENSYQAIFMDSELDGADGLLEAKKIKDQHSETKIIMVSGHTYSEYFTKIKESGADDYLSKPVKIDNFVSKVKEYIS